MVNIQFSTCGFHHNHNDASVSLTGSIPFPPPPKSDREGNLENALSIALKSEYLNSCFELLRNTTYVPELKIFLCPSFSSLLSEQLINVSYLLVFLEPTWKARSSKSGWERGRDWAAAVFDGLCIPPPSQTPPKGVKKRVLFTAGSQ